MTARKILQTEMHAIAGVFICAFCLFLLGMLKALFAPDSIYADPLASPLLVAGFTLLIGLPIAILYGAPLYLILGRTRSPNTLLVLAIGAAPALLFANSGTYMFLHALSIGMVASWLTHLLSSARQS